MTAGRLFSSLGLLFVACCASGPVSSPRAVPEASPAREASPGASLRVEVPGGAVEVTLEPGELAVSRDELRAWVKNAADAIVAYFGRFPVARAEVVVTPSRGSGVSNGVAGARGEARITIEVGRQATASDLATDWVLTHEMVHLAFPSVGHAWLEEGIATYVEPLARARTGLLPERQLWKETVEGMPNGLPAPGDRGLDGTPTWGRTYWGGALFCLVADIEIRERTAGRRGLEDGLRAVLASGGTVEESWPIERALEVADRATGERVLESLSATWRREPVAPDLGALWRKLGVRVRDASVELDDRAPAAWIRRALVSPAR